MYFIKFVLRTFIKKLTCDINISVDITINEISYDLLTSTNFTLLPRNNSMMPMPFVTNDAIIGTKRIVF